MTKNDARNILIHHNKWRRGQVTVMMRPRDLGDAVDTICEPPTIAQSIRDAAINWPQYSGEME